VNCEISNQQLLELLAAPESWDWEWNVK